MILNSSLLLLICTVVLVLLLRFHWKRKELYLFSWQAKGPFAWPLIGSAFKFKGESQDITRALQDFYKKYAASVMFWFGPIPFYIVSSPEEFSVILNSPKTLKKDPSYDLFRPALGDGLITGPVHIWKMHRKALNPTFNQKILDSYVKIFQEQSLVLVEKLKAYVGKGEFDIIIPINLYTLDILCESAMGVRLHGQDRESRFIYCFNRAKAIVFKRLYHLFYRFDFIFNRTKLAKEFYGLNREVREFTRAVVQRKRAEIQARNEKLTDSTDTDEFDDGKAKRKSFLEYVLELTDDENKFTDEDCIDEVTTFMTAGSDTSATANSFTCLSMGLFPDIQEKVFEELDEVFGDSDRPITFEDIPKLKYLERVIRESMRIFPPLLVFARETTEDLRINGVTVPRGIGLLLVILNAHRDPKNFPDPLKFDPDRFLPEESSKRHPYAYLPFSGGARNCIGFQFGLMSMKVTMATILRTYKFKTSYKRIEDIELAMHITTKPVNGYMVEAEYRNPHKHELK